MIGDTFIQIIVWLLRNSVLKVVPYDLPFVPVADFQSYLTSLTTFLTPVLALLNLVFNLPLLLSIPLVIVGSETFIFLLKTGIFGANIARGSGA